MVLVNLAAVAAVRLVPATGGRPFDVEGEIEVVRPAPSPAHRRERLEDARSGGGTASAVGSGSAGTRRRRQGVAWLAQRSMAVLRDMSGQRG